MLLGASTSKRLNLYAVLGGASVALFILLSITAYRGSPSTRAALTSGFNYAQEMMFTQTDAFSGYRRDHNCNFDSRNLHHAFKPQCTAKDEVLKAMSQGGRYGLDAPYSARGCDFQFFRNEEICRIMSKFDHIYIVGDSYMRQVAETFFFYLRRDLIDGARAKWVEGEPPEESCHCRALVQSAHCVSRTVLHSMQVWQSDPTSFGCGPEPFANITYWEAMAYPVDEAIIHGFVSSIANKNEPDGRQAFIFAHGVWNSFEHDKTERWLEQFEQAMESAMPRYFDKSVIGTSKFPRIFILPHAQAWNKAEGWIPTQNNLVVQKHAMALEPVLKKRGYDVLGTYNMTLQASSYDGTHTNMEGNLLKVMFLFNWLHHL